MGCCAQGQDAAVWSQKGQQPQSLVPQSRATRLKIVPGCSAIAGGGFQWHGAAGMRHSSPQGARQDDCIRARIPLPWASPALVNTILWQNSWESCMSRRTTGSPLSGAHNRASSQQRGRAGQKGHEQLHNENLCLNLAGFNQQIDLKPQAPGSASHQVSTST